jgi:hypothetical protein
LSYDGQQLFGVHDGASAAGESLIALGWRLRAPLRAGTDHSHRPRDALLDAAQNIEENIFDILPRDPNAPGQWRTPGLWRRVAVGAIAIHVVALVVVALLQMISSSHSMCTSHETIHYPTS